MTDKISSTEIMGALRSRLSKISETIDQQEASVVTEVGDGIAHISGLRTAMAGELLEFTSSANGRSVYGLAQNLDQDEVGVRAPGGTSGLDEGPGVRLYLLVFAAPSAHLGHSLPQGTSQQACAAAPRLARCR